MKLKQLVEITPAMRILAETKLPIKIGYRIAKNLKAIQPELEAYEEQRVKLAKELGTPTEDGQQYTFSAMNAIAFSNQMNVLLDEESIVALQTVSLADLGDISIEPAHLAALDGVVITE